MKTVACLLACGWLAGCATYSTYRCPEPIGEIVRQDCDDYRVRYESLAAKLNFSIGSLKLGAELGTDHLRDPSELVQVMMHQMLSLCHDYNACRVSPVDYRRKREAHDLVFTAVMALLDQLRAPGLDAENRSALLAELFAMLRGAPATAAPGTAKPDTDTKAPGKPKITDGFFRRAHGTWYESRYPPPKPPPLARGVPFVLEADPHHERDGTLSHFFVRLWGEVQEDDGLVIEADGTPLRCSIRRRPRKPEGMATCKPADGQTMPQATRFRARYTPGATGKQHDLGVIDLDPAHAARRAWLAFQPDPVRVDPIKAERPWLLVSAVVEKRPFTSARCWVGRKPVADSDGAGVLKALGDVDRDSRTGLTRFAIPLPFTLPYPGNTVTDGLLTDHAGAWRCKISIDAEPYLEVRFTVQDDGNLAPHPEQQGRPGDVASPWWLVDSRRLQGES